MTNKFKKLLIECHPDRHGGDHSKMEKFFKAIKDNNPPNKISVRVYCNICGCRIGFRAKRCMIHRNVAKQLA